jgi:hypothetical protein
MKKIAEVFRESHAMMFVDNNSAIWLKAHTCVFSRDSLKRLSGATGSEVASADPPRAIGHHYHPLFIFRKARSYRLRPSR